MSILSFFGHSKPECAYPTDTIETRDGGTLQITFFQHASLLITLKGDKHIYIDPVKTSADYRHLPKADLVIVTHSHYDHLDLEAVDMITSPSTDIVCDRTSADTFDKNCHTMRPGNVVSPRDYIKIEAVAAYNTTPSHQQFHPQEREDCGYVLNIQGTRIYIAGDSEPTPQMLSLRDIDIAFLPVNQPYTMTVDQAVKVIETLRPSIFYPYHYGQVEEVTNLDALQERLKGITDIRIRPME